MKKGMKPNKEKNEYMLGFCGGRVVCWKQRSEGGGSVMNES